MFTYQERMRAVMDITGILSRSADLLFNHTWGLVGALVVILLVVLFWTSIPIPRRWHCSRCGERFYSEAEAKGHQSIHAEHKAVMELD